MVRCGNVMSPFLKEGLPAVHAHPLQAVEKVFIRRMNLSYHISCWELIHSIWLLILAKHMLLHASKSYSLWNSSLW